MSEDKESIVTNGKDESGENVGPVKTAKQLEKEAKKAEKLAKLEAKLAKQRAQAEAANQNQEKKEKKAKKTEQTVVYTANTTPGDMKDVSSEFPDAYSPRYVEAQWYSWWEKQGFFKPEFGRSSIKDENAKGKFVMVIPPPNVTGTLHLGHALTNAIEDAITRYNRMKGKTTLWVPGCDHAGIATQVVVEKLLWRTEEKTRHDLGRERFIEEVWKWRREKGGRIYEQLKGLGSSLDWSRVSFTMDAKLCRAVNEAFVRLHEDGYIYRSERLVNWSCTLKSAISDIEVEKVEIAGRTAFRIPGYTSEVEFGVLVKFAYLIDDIDLDKANDLDFTEVVVATTRIETMLGDTAIAVHPNDKRYKHLHGKFVKHPFCKRKLPIICDEYVDMNFGTGVVKITPAHDPNDYELGKRHNLPFINIFTDDGRILSDYECFAGLKRFDCRKSLLLKLQEMQLYRGCDNNPMVVPFCSRSKDVVEPMIKPQWYVKCSEMATDAIKVVRTGELKIIPEYHAKLWYHWMEGIRDWCVSRQLWWGHRIPAYYTTFNDPTITSGSYDDDTYWVVGRTKEEALQKASQKFQVPKENIVLQQDEDVLDTWFSSALFPFSVFGWPDNTDDLNAFYPTTLLETGHDILFFWVARMVFFGQKLMKQLPFKTVYLHPMVRDAHGRKMSKSLGNVIDPIDVIRGISLQDLYQQLENSNLHPTELKTAQAGLKQDFPNGIPECGSDALRFALCSYITQARDINLDINRVQGYRYFCNKVWNATKFGLSHLTTDMNAHQSYHTDTFEIDGSESNMDLWILSRLASAINTCNSGFEQFDFGSITSACYSFWLYDFCDVYLECVKPLFRGKGTEEEIYSARKVLFVCLDIGLRLLSPFMPFVTEELWQRLPHSNKHTLSICVANYPENVNWINMEIEKDVEFIQKVARLIRSTKSEYNVPTKTKVTAYIICTDAITRELLKKYSQNLLILANCSKIEFDVLPENLPSGCITLMVKNQCYVHLMLKGLVEVDKEIEKWQNNLQQVKKSLRTHEICSERNSIYKEKLLQFNNDVARIETIIENLSHLQ